jgi:hypothetical protein
MIAQWTKIGNENAIIIDPIFFEILKMDGNTRLRVSKEGQNLILTPIRDSKKAKRKKSPKAK